MFARLIPLGLCGVLAAFAARAEPAAPPHRAVVGPLGEKLGQDQHHGVVAGEGLQEVADFVLHLRLHLAGQVGLELDVKLGFVRPPRIFAQLSAPDLLLDRRDMRIGEQCLRNLFADAARFFERCTGRSRDA